MPTFDSDMKRVNAEIEGAQKKEEARKKEQEADNKKTPPPKIKALCAA